MRDYVTEYSQALTRNFHRCLLGNKLRDSVDIATSGVYVDCSPKKTYGAFNTFEEHLETLNIMTLCR